MLKKFNRNIIFIVCTCLCGLVAAAAFELIVNLIFRQPTFFFSIDRFLAISISLAGLICLVRYHKYFCKNLHKAFLLIAFTFGISLIAVFPRTVYLSPDDQIHFKNAYFFMSDTVNLKGGFSAIESSGFTNVKDKGFDEMASVYAAMNEANQVTINEEHQTHESPQLYARIVYLPFYIGFQISNFLRLSFTNSVVLAKLFNFICYTLLIYFAIKISGRFNKIFFILGLLTSNIFLATQFSYDPLTFASLMLAISLFLHIRQSDQVSAIYFFGFILAATFGSLTKAVYCPILLLALLIPYSKFDCKKRAIAFKICAMFVMLVLAATFVLPILNGGLASDIRGGNTSVGGQIGFLLNNPLKAIVVIVNFITSQLPSLLFDPTFAFVSLGVTATAAPIYNLCLPVVPMVGACSLLVLLWATFRTEVPATIITQKTKISLLFIYLILIGATTASMYLSFTSVGSLIVDGMQPRYLMPFFPLLLILFMPITKLRRESRLDYAILFVPCICLALILATYILRMSML